MRHVLPRNKTIRALQETVVVRICCSAAGVLLDKTGNGVVGVPSAHVHGLLHDLSCKIKHA